MVLIKEEDLIELKKKTMMKKKILYVDEFFWLVETTCMQSLWLALNCIMNVEVYGKLQTNLELH